MAHSHFVHDLKVVLVLMPGPLQVEITQEQYCQFVMNVKNTS